MSLCDLGSNQLYILNMHQIRGSFFNDMLVTIWYYRKLVINDKSHDRCMNVIVTIMISAGE